MDGQLRGDGRHVRSYIDEGVSLSGICEGLDQRYQSWQDVVVYRASSPACTTSWK